MSSSNLSASNGTIEDSVGWRTAALRELCLRGTLVDPAKEPARDFEYVDVSSVSADRLAITSTTTVRGPGAPSRARKLLREGDVIFATIRPTLRRVAMVPGSLDGQLASTAFCVIRANPEVADPRFLYFASITDDFVQRVGALERGASYPAVTDSNILDQQIAVPPLPEQRAIASVLSKLQARVELQDRIVAALEELKNATMAKLFREGLRGERLKQTEIGEIPESWVVKPLGSLWLSSAFGPRFSSSLYSRDGAVATLRTTDIDEDGDVTYANMPRARLLPQDLAAHLLRPGDLLITRSGTCGIAAVFDEQPLPVIPGAFLIRVRLPAQVSGQFLRLWINSTGRSMIQGLAMGAVQKNISGTSLATLLVPQPEATEQQEIVDRLLALEHAARAVGERADWLRILFDSALRSLMTATLRVVAPAKEAS